MDTLQCILTRRSVRKFTSDPVLEDDLNKILEAVRYAPTWANTQCFELVLVRSNEVKSALQQTLPNGNPAREGLMQAPLVIALAAKRGCAGGKQGQFMTEYGDWFMFDAGIAAQNLCLAAHALGYGTVHVGLLNHAAAAKVLHLPADVALLELIPIGRPAKVPSAPKRRELSQFVHQEKYGKVG